MPESYTHDQLMEMVRDGWQLDPYTPGLDAAAKEVVRPLVAGMQGQKIIYHCRVSSLMRVDELTVSDEGFRAVAMRLQRYRHPEPEMEAMAVVREKREAVAGVGPLKFRASWSMLHLCGKAVKMAMVCDFFITDQDVVTAVEAAAERGESPKAVYDLIYGATRREAGIGSRTARGMDREAST